MDHERRIAKWNPAPPRVRNLSWSAFVGLYRPGWQLLLACVAICLVSFMIGGPANLAGISFFALFILFALFLSGSLDAIRLVVGSRPELEQPDFDDPTPRMLVRLQLSAGGYIYGSDRGVLMLVDDWLIFEGERTSFSLAAHDVADLRRRWQVRDCHAVDFRLRNLAADVRVKFTSYKPGLDPNRFLQAWVERDFPHPTVSVLPPLDPMSGLPDPLAARYDSGKDGRIPRYFLCAFIPTVLISLICDMAGMSLDFSLFASYTWCVGSLATMAIWARSERRTSLAMLSAHLHRLPAPPAEAERLSTPAITNGSGRNPLRG